MPHSKVGACRTLKVGKAALEKTSNRVSYLLNSKEAGMTQERLPVRKIREILRLKNEGFTNRTIARICKVSNSTVGEYLERARQAGLSWPWPEGLSEEALYQRLFGEKKVSSQSGARGESQTALAGIPRAESRWIREDAIW
jgi:hypothetical protein